MVGDRRVTQEPKRKVAGSGRREGKKHHNDFVIFHNRNGAKRWEPLWKGGRGGVKSTQPSKLRPF